MPLYGNQMNRTSLIRLVLVNFNLFQCLYVASIGIAGEVFHISNYYLCASRRVQEAGRFNV